MYYDSKVPFIDPKKMINTIKRKTHHNFLSPNCFSTLHFNNDVVIIENNSHVRDPGRYAKENTDKRKNSINIINGNRKSNIRPLICASQKYFQNHIHMVQRRIVPGNHSYPNATQHQRRKAVMIRDSHLS